MARPKLKPPAPDAAVVGLPKRLGVEVAGLFMPKLKPVDAAVVVPPAGAPKLNPGIFNCREGDLFKQINICNISSQSEVNRMAIYFLWF